jgi:hypothetical protein
MVILIVTGMWMDRTGQSSRRIMAGAHSATPAVWLCEISEQTASAVHRRATADAMNCARCFFCGVVVCAVGNVRAKQPSLWSGHKVFRSIIQGFSKYKIRVLPIYKLKKADKIRLAIVLYL